MDARESGREDLQKFLDQYPPCAGIPEDRPAQHPWEVFEPLAPHFHPFTIWVLGVAWAMVPLGLLAVEIAVARAVWNWGTR